MAITGLFNIAKLSLQAQQVAMQVTGHNIANVNTPGFSRQEAILENTTPTDGNPGQVGTGVQAAEIRRKYDRFIEAQIADGKEEFSNLETQKEVLSRIEALVNDSQGLGLNRAMGDFFQSLQDLSNNPAGKAERTLVLNRANTLSAIFRRTGQELTQIQKDVNQQVAQSVTEINQLTSQIADLNDKIAQAEITGQNANDLRDMRGRVLNDVSSKIDIQYFEDSSGQVTVFTANVANLVEGNSSRNLLVSSNAGNSGYNDVLYDPGSGSTVNITTSIRNGEMKGLLDSRDVTLDNVKSQMDQLAFSFVSDMNTQHQAGYGLDGSTGTDLFTSLGSAADASVNMTVAISNTDLLAASSTQAGLPGNNTNALALSQMQNQLTMSSGSATFDSYYNAVAQEVGADTQQVDRSLSAQEFSMQQLENMREATSGVSLDEEMTNLIKFQRAFQASARLITLTDEMLKTVIEMV